MAPIDSAKADEVFDTFFGTENPFAGLVKDVTELWTKIDADAAAPKAPEPIKMDLKCTLEELYNGCIKTVKVERRRLDDSGELSTYAELLTVNVGKGWKDLTQLTYAKHPKDITGDVVLTLRQQKHEVYVRDGDNLLHTTPISLLAALTGHVFTLTTMDKRVLNIPVDDVVHPKYKKVMHGEGMPGAGGARGDLIISFDIGFPDALKDEQKGLLKYTLKLPTEISTEQKKLLALALRLPDITKLDEERLAAFNDVLNNLRPVPEP